MNNIKTEHTKRYMVLWQLSGISTVMALNKTKALVSISKDLLSEDSYTIKDIIRDRRINPIRGIKELK